MVKKKGEKEKTSRDWLTEELDRINKSNPVVRTRWYVVEVTPGKWYSVGDGHGGSDSVQDPDKVSKVSPYYETREEALAWYHEHEADEGSTLKVAKQNLRRKVTEEWTNW